MKKLSCDVLVVGAGPAGLAAARATAMRGLKTIVIEEHAEIGEPVQCGEAIGEYLFPYLPFPIPKEQLIWRIKGMYFWADGIEFERQGVYWRGYSVDRKQFDRWLGDMALQHGAIIKTNTKLTNLTLNEEYIVTRAIVEKKDGEMIIYPKVVIAADGSESTVLRVINLYKPKKGDLAEVYSWEMKNMELINPHLEQIYAGDFTPSGYAYIFPKSKKVANVGVGGLFPKKDMKEYFDEFMNLNIVKKKKQTKHATPVIEKSKKAVWNDLSDKWVYGNIVLTGDVANQSLKPFVEGILPSIICGDIAGIIAYKLCHGEIAMNEKYVHKVMSILKEEYRQSKILEKLIPQLFLSDEEGKYLKFIGLICDMLSPKEIINKKWAVEELRKILLERANQYEK